MVRQVTIRPINSIFFVSGGGFVDVPADHVDRTISLVAASRDCLIVCSHPEVDGPTDLTIGQAHEVDPGYPPGFVGTLQTRSGRIIIDQVDDHVVHNQAVDQSTVMVTLWFSDARWPAQICIGID